MKTAAIAVLFGAFIGATIQKVFDVDKINDAVHNEMQANGLEDECKQTLKKLDSNSYVQAIPNGQQLALVTQ